MEGKEQLEGTGPSFPHMGPGDRSQIIRFGGTCHEVTVEGEKNPTLFLFVCLCVCMGLCVHTHNQRGISKQM